MSRIVIPVLIVAVLIGAAIWLAGRDASRPQTRIEQVVPDNALAR